MACSPLLSDEDLQRFRTKPCQRLKSCKGCDFGESRCQYSHNGFWNRRSPFYVNSKDSGNLRYIARFCPDIRLSGEHHRIEENSCLRGGGCPFAHSGEERLYHPQFYKTEPCNAFREGECGTYYCPFVHGLAEKREIKKYSLPYVPPDLKSALLDDHVVVVKTRKSDSRRSRSNCQSHSQKEKEKEKEKERDPCRDGNKESLNDARTGDGVSKKKGQGLQSPPSPPARLATYTSPSNSLSRRVSKTPGSRRQTQDPDARCLVCEIVPGSKSSNPCLTGKSMRPSGNSMSTPNFNCSGDCSSQGCGYSRAKSGSRRFASLLPLEEHMRDRTPLRGPVLVDENMDAAAYVQQQINNITAVLENPCITESFSPQDWISILASAHRLSGSAVAGQTAYACESTPSVVHGSRSGSTTADRRHGLPTWSQADGHILKDQSRRSPSTDTAASTPSPSIRDRRMTGPQSPIHSQFEVSRNLTPPANPSLRGLNLSREWMLGTGLTATGSSQCSIMLPGAESFSDTLSPNTGTRDSLGVTTTHSRLLTTDTSLQDPSITCCSCVQCMTNATSSSSTSKSLSQVDLEQSLSNNDGDPFVFTEHHSSRPSASLSAFLSNPNASQQLSASLNAAKNLAFTDPQKDSHSIGSNQPANDCTEKAGEASNESLMGQGDGGVEASDQTNANGLPDLRWYMGMHKIQPESYFGGRHQYLKEDPLRRQFGTSGSFGVANTNSESQSRGSPAPFC